MINPISLKKKQVLIEKQHPNGQLINIKQLSISSNFQFNQLTIRTKIPNFAKNTWTLISNYAQNHHVINKKT